MSNAEEILKEYAKFEDINGTKTVELLPLTIVDAMYEHTNQTLDELKAKVEEVRHGNGEYDEASYIKIDYVIQLIDEAINE